MAFDLVTQDTVFKPDNLLSFIKHLRRHQQKSIINSGTYLCWESFRNKKFLLNNSEMLHLVNAYSPKVMVLALATTNDYRDLTVDNKGIYEICSSYLHIPTPISDKEFLDKEAEKIAEELTKQSHNKWHIDKEKIITELIRESCSVMFISRGVGLQHRNFIINIEEIYRDYRILQLLGAEAFRILENFFGMSVLQIIRSAWGLFSLGNNPNNNGTINFNKLTCDDDLTKNLDIDLNTCVSVALNISYKESDLRLKWLNTKVLSEEELYQQYVPDPLFTHPLIHRDKSNIENHFLIPSPGIFIRSFREKIFSTILQKSDEKLGMGEKLGNAIEAHIQEALEHIFKKANVQKLESEDKHADFHISLGGIDLIIEVKSMIGGFLDKCVMKPEHVAKMWNRLYGASIQCAHSQIERKTVGRKVVSIVIIADHITAEHLPFQHYASKSGLFYDLGIEAIEFISWNALENRLAQTSINEFEKTLIEKWNNPDAMTVESLMSLEMKRDTPAHSYEYLKDAENEIFNKM